MRLTQKIKSAINILNDAEKEVEKSEHNYIHFNRSKYFVFKNNLYKTQKYSKPMGTIKNGRIVLKGHKSIETLKHVQKRIRKIKSKTNKNVTIIPESKSFEKTEVFEEPHEVSEQEKVSAPEPIEKTELFEPEKVSGPQEVSIPEEASIPVSEPLENTNKGIGNSNKNKNKNKNGSTMKMS